MSEEQKAKTIALVVLSGGQDSTTCLWWAKSKFDEVHAITFNYGQRHAIELDAAREVAKLAGVASHRFVEFGHAPILVGKSPLVSSNPVGQYESAEALPGGIEPTFVPGRNLLFAVIAANQAVAVGATNLVMGVCQEDFGGYPDCRQDFVNAMQLAINEGFFGPEQKDKWLTIDTPLMNLTKKETVLLAKDLPGCFDALALTHTCYNGKYPPDPYNHASILRARGFAQAGLPDPLIDRAKQEGKLPADYPDSGLVEGTKYGKAVEDPAPVKRKVIPPVEASPAPAAETEAAPASATPETQG